MLAQKPLQDIVTFTRSSSATRFNASGVLETVGNNVPRLDYEPADVPILGAELIANGAFETDASGWVSGLGSASDSVVSGAYQITNAAPYSSRAYQINGLTPGKTYRATATVNIVSGGNYAFLQVLSGQAGGIVFGQIQNVGSGTWSFDFTPTTSTAYVHLRHEALNAVHVWDSVSVKEFMGYTVRKGDPKGILIEEQRTNLIVQSVNPALSPWQGAAQGATYAGGKIIPSASNGMHGLVQPQACGNVAVTYQIKLKAAEYSKVRLNFTDQTTGDVLCDFDLSVGTKSAVTTAGSWSAASATIKPDADGYYLCTLTATKGAGTNAAPIVYVMNSQNTSYAGDGVGGVYAKDPQLEIGSFATSYIPTSGSQVTRAADICSINTLSPWYNSAEGTIYAEASVPQNPPGSTFPMVARFAGVAGEAISVGFFTTISAFEVVSGSVGQAGLYPPTSALLRKAAGAYALNSFGLSVNGSVPFTDSSGVVPAVSTMWIGSTGSGLFLNGHIRKIRYFPKRLTDAQLQALTA